ncbi:ComEC/Rec2 family competence protein [Zhihengliuella sp.]|uniref:ComEC/Rec2 family competence protein n=1 Tax=Zhihengliuella sp. TaxID=1954483 RepID=UPI002811EACD|nr:ComEC/Rec2 family competence protein [Zhihengliuella sp.]
MIRLQDRARTLGKAWEALGRGRPRQEPALALRQRLREATRLDARSLCGVVGAWSAATLLPPGEPLIAVWSVVGGSALLVGALWFIWRNTGVVAWSSHWWGPVAVAAAGFVLVGLPVAAAALAGHAPQLDDHVASLDTVRAELTLIDDPREVRVPAGGGGESGADVVVDGTTRPGERGSAAALTADARIERYYSEGRWFRTGTPVVLRFPPLEAGAAEGKGPTDLSRGDRVYGLVRLSPTGPGATHRFWAETAAPPDIVRAERGGLADTLRDRFSDAAVPLPEYGRALLPGMVMGDRSGQDAALEDAMKAAGLAHLTAVSGANCALVMGSVLWTARLCRAPRGLGFAASVASLAAFVVLVGPDPSVIRAAAMGAIACAAVYGGRGRRAFAALCACIVILLAVEPVLAGEPGFQLSVLATAGIVLLGRPLALLLARGVPGWLADGLAISIAAQLFCQPVILQMTPTFSTYSVLANLVVAPLVPVVTVVGTLALVAGLLPAIVVAPLVWTAGLPAQAVGVVGTRVAAWPEARMPWPAGALGAALAISILLLALSAVWLASSEQRSRRVLAGTAGTLAGAVLLGTVLPATRWLEPEVGQWRVAACDVGQGDALILNLGDQRAAMIDVGNEPDLLADCLRAVGVSSIELLFITHLHADHYGAWRELADVATIGTVYYSTGDPAAAAEWSAEMADLTGVRPAQLAAGRHGKRGPVAWEVLSPAHGETPRSENDASLVLDMTLAGTPVPLRLLATGDIEIESMSRLIDTGAVPDVDVLKVAHHGARNGGLEILDAARPEAAIVSVGADNSYGHPAPEIRAGFRKAGVPLFRTDEHGTLLLSVENGSEGPELVVRSLPAARVHRRRYGPR